MKLSNISNGLREGMEYVWVAEKVYKGSSEEEVGEEKNSRNLRSACLSHPREIFQNGWNIFRSRRLS